MFLSNDYTSVDALLGKTLTFVEINDEDREILFVTSTGEQFKMLHIQDCCESVYLSDVIGDLQDLVGSEILEAEESMQDGSELQESITGDDYYRESCTWTFYKLGTHKGRVHLRWCGSSNGYYSEGVNFIRIPGESKLEG